MKNAYRVKEILTKGSITSWYQPIIDLKKPKLLGWESLTRGPSISPLHSAPALFSAAQEANLLKPLELMCVKNTMKSFEQLQLPGKLFINMSHELFLAGNHLRKQLKALIDNGPVPPHRIVIKLTAQSATSDLSKLSEAILFFHGLGFQIAIDDLGIGDLSKQEWMELSPDYVKVSREFINNIDQDVDKQKLVSSIVYHAQSAGTKVIALGVETHGELEKLKTLGIELCQGYLVQRPELAPVAPDLRPFGASPVSLVREESDSKSQKISA